MRRLWIRVHLVIGLTAGAIFVVMGLSGSALVFHQGLDRWLNPEQMTAPFGETWKSLDELVAAARAAEPARVGPAAMEWPYDDRGALVFWFKEPATAREGEEADWFEVDVDPYTGKALGARSYTGHFTGFLYELHESLMVGSVGEALVALTGVLLAVSLATGAYLWWPRSGRMLQAFSFQDRSHPAQRHLDLHRLTGVVFLLVLMVVALSGVGVIYREEIPPLLNEVVTVRHWPGQLNSTVRPDTPPLSASQVVAIARQRFPRSTVRWLDFPVDATDVFRIGLRNPREPAGAGAAATDRLWLDQYTGELLAERDWQTFSSIDKVLSVMVDLHNGQAFGLPGRVIVCLAGLALPILYVTALRMWWLKRTARRRKPATAQAIEPSRRSLPLSASHDRTESPSDLAR